MLSVLSMENFVGYVQPWLPDFVVRWIVWLYLAYQLRRLNGLDHPMKELRTVKRIKRQGGEVEKENKFSRVAERTEAANEQHYEVPTDFFVGHLGPCRKYSSCEWGPIRGELADEKSGGGKLPSTLAEAETYTFDSYLSKMRIDEVPADGSGRVLEIGCGWGSFLLYAASKYPALNFVGFSNSSTQIAHILSEADNRGLKNVSALRLDINDFCDAQLRPEHIFGPTNLRVSPMKSRADSTDLGLSPSKISPAKNIRGRKNGLVANGGTSHNFLFDRLFSCECLEHSKDYERAFKAMSEVLKDDGKVFVQILCHREYTYFMNNDDWMGRNFFTGGTIPSTKLFMFFTKHLVVDDTWYIRGSEYSKTLDAWLNNLHKNRLALKNIFRENGYASPSYELEKWRMFYIMSSVSFGFNKGKEWMVAYFTFSKR